MNRNDKIFVAGHNGLVGSAVVRKLRSLGYYNIITASKKDLDLTSYDALNGFMYLHKPDYVFLCAAKVGGIGENEKYPADFIYTNLCIQNNVLHLSHLHEVKKLLFLGSSCIYPKHCEQPMNEDCLLSGKLEPTNSAYAMAKITGIEMCKAYRKQYGCNYIAVMPTNLYGPNDDFNLENSHVLPALIRKFHEAKQLDVPSVYMWGTGNAKREFLHVDDLSDALVFLMKNYDNGDILNIGYGNDVSILELATLVKNIIGYKGNLIWDSSKPDGTPRKLLDSSKINNLGWKPLIDLNIGIKETYEWFIKNQNNIRK
jgi:GDP-L-fucose synthase